MALRAYTRDALPCGSLGRGRYGTVFNTPNVDYTTLDTMENEMGVTEQVEIIEKQLANFDNLFDKLHWLTIGFDPDPAYSKEATNIVRGNLVRAVDDGLPVR